jgi:hypothetical protein
MQKESKIYDKITIMVKKGDKIGVVPITTESQTDIISALRLLQSNPDVPETIRVIELDKSKFSIMPLFEEDLHETEKKKILR